MLTIKDNKTLDRLEVIDEEGHLIAHASYLLLEGPTPPQLEDSLIWASLKEYYEKGANSGRSNIITKA